MKAHIIVLIVYMLVIAALGLWLLLIVWRHNKEVKKSLAKIELIEKILDNTEKALHDDIVTFDFWIDND